MTRTNDSLTALERGGLLRRSAGGQSRAYAFHHVMSQEAAYHSLLKADRSRLHAAVAAVLLALSEDDREDTLPGDIATSLAFHYERAGDDQNLCRWAVRAGDDAGRRFASREALDFYDRALGAAERCGGRAPLDFVRAAYAGRGNILRTTGEPQAALATFAAMRSFGERAGDDAITIEALNHINTIRIITPDAAAGTALSDLESDIARARSLAFMHGDSALCARAVWNAGLRVRFTDLDTAAERFGEALAIAESDPDARRRDLREVTATAAADLAVIRAISGEFQQSLAHSVQAVAAARTLDNGALLADALGDLAINAFFAGDPETLRKAKEEALAISAATQNPWGLAYSNWTWIEHLIDRGDYEQARAQTAETLPAARASGMPVFVGFYQAMASQLARLSGDMGGALQFARESQAAFLSVGGENWTIAGEGMGVWADVLAGDISSAGERLARVWTPGQPPRLPYQGYRWVLPAFGEYALRTGTETAALAFLDWYVEVRERHAATRLAAEGRYWRGRLRAASGSFAGASEDLARARETFERLGGLDHVWRIDAARSMLAGRMGDASAAAAARDSARQIVDALASRLSGEAQRLTLTRQFREECDE